MPQPETLPVPASDVPPSQGMVSLTHLMYALHAFAVVTGVAGSATIVGSFVASLPSIAAVIINYVKRGDVRGTWLESHFRWQLRTFWLAVLAIVVAVGFGITIIGLPLAFLLILGAGLWVAYRIGRGWWTLGQRASLPMV